MYGHQMSGISGIVLQFLSKINRGWPVRLRREVRVGIGDERKVRTIKGHG
jgi:hypothetical protein